MKYNEFHRLILRSGWKVARQKGSHVIYVKDDQTETVPNHGVKEMPESLRLTLIKRMGLR